MLHLPETDDNLTNLTDEKVNEFVVINFSQYSKIIRPEQNFRKVARSHYIFLTTPDKVEKYMQSNSSDNCIHQYNIEILNLFDSELELINGKIMIKKINKNNF